MTKANKETVNLKCEKREKIEAKLIQLEDHTNKNVRDIHSTKTFIKTRFKNMIIDYADARDAGHTSALIQSLFTQPPITLLKKTAELLIRQLCNFHIISL